MDKDDEDWVENQPSKKRSHRETKGRKKNTKTSRNPAMLLLQKRRKKLMLELKEQRPFNAFDYCSVEIEYPSYEAIGMDGMRTTVNKSSSDLPFNPSDYCREEYEYGDGYAEDENRVIDENEMKTNSDIVGSGNEIMFDASGYGGDESYGGDEVEEEDADDQNQKFFSPFQLCDEIKKCPSN
jgi:hypothetical protein